MNKREWRAYGDLAWTESIVGSPEDCREETELFGKLMKDNSKIEVGSLLHLGCGAGASDYTFKRHFQVTGVDLSEDMLAIASKRNPEIRYVRGDMRDVRLGERFDAVVIPDCIDYMRTEEDLRKAIGTASEHLRPGGVLLIVANTIEEFAENNFAYSGCEGDVEITIFENNYIPKSSRTGYEATLIYLIRRSGKLEIHTDRHELGLFPLATWLHLLRDRGFTVRQVRLDHTYDRFILAEGAYPLTIFVCCSGVRGRGNGL